MSRTFDALGNDTEHVVFDNLGSQVTVGSDRAVLFRDYADRDRGSSCSAHAWSLVNCVKFTVEQGLGVRLGQPRGLPWLHMRGGTPVRSCK